MTGAVPMNPVLRVRASMIAAAFVLSNIAVAQETSKAEAHNMRLVGYSALQGRPAYQPVIQRQGERWIAYIGHHGDRKMNQLTGVEENNGTSIVDVTNPKSPQYLAHIPGEE